MPRLTKPDTLESWLPSAGFDFMKNTKHVFIGVEPFAIKFATTTYRAHGMMYKCTETGAVRRWGYQ